jgi:hypothetical protein
MFYPLIAALLSELDENAVDFVSDRALQSSVAESRFPKISAKGFPVKLLLQHSTLIFFHFISLAPCEVACLRWSCLQLCSRIVN